MVNLHLHWTNAIVWTTVFLVYWGIEIVQNLVPSPLLPLWFPFLFTLWKLVAIANVHHIAGVNSPLVYTINVKRYTDIFTARYTSFPLEIHCSVRLLRERLPTFMDITSIHLEGNMIFHLAQTVMDVISVEIRNTMVTLSLFLSMDIDVTSTNFVLIPQCYILHWLGSWMFYCLIFTYCYQVHCPWIIIDNSGGSKGAARDARPPPGQKFLHFHAVFGKNWPNNRLAPPLWG